MGRGSAALPAVCRRLKLSTWAQIRSSRTQKCAATGCVRCHGIEKAQVIVYGNRLGILAVGNLLQRCPLCCAALLQGRKARSWVCTREPVRSPPGSSPALPNAGSCLILPLRLRSSGFCTRDTGRSPPGNCLAMQKAGLLTLPLGCKAQVLAPGSQAGQHLVLRRAALGVQLPRQHLDAQQLTQLGVVSARAYTSKLLQ